MKKSIVMFVHGFGSNAECWTHLSSMIRNDDELNSRIDLEFFEYTSKWFNLNPWEKIPTLLSCAKLLDTRLSLAKYTERDLVLVGHSQGGLVIQKYLSSKLSTGDGLSLRNICQVLMFATPNLGSTFISGVRKLVFLLLGNPQEKSLRVLNEEIAEISKQMVAQILNATAYGKSEAFIPVTTFGGVKDKIVPGPSAQGPFIEYHELPGNHFTIIEPKNTEDLRYLKFKEALVDPLGHKNVFEIEDYNTEITVAPYTVGPNNEKGPIHLERGYPLGDGMIYQGEPRKIDPKTKGRIHRSVRFSRMNRCTDKLFDIRYMTLDDGLLFARHSPKKNLTTKANIGNFTRKGVHIHFEFKPEQNKDHYLDIDIYKGFDGDNQNVHFHLGRGLKKYRQLRYMVDISKLVNSNSKLDMMPRLYYALEEPEDGCADVCRNPEDRHLQRSISKGLNVWEWKLENVRGGIITIIWKIIVQ